MRVLIVVRLFPASSSDRHSDTHRQQHPTLPEVALSTLMLQHAQSDALTLTLTDAATPQTATPSPTDRPPQTDRRTFQLTLTDAPIPELTLQRNRPNNSVTDAPTRSD